MKKLILLLSLLIILCSCSKDVTGDDTVNIDINAHSYGIFEWTINVNDIQVGGNSQTVYEHYTLSGKIKIMFWFNGACPVEVEIFQDNETVFDTTFMFGSGYFELILNN